MNSRERNDVRHECPPDTFVDFGVAVSSCDKFPIFARGTFVRATSQRSRRLTGIGFDGPSPRADSHGASVYKSYSMISVPTASVPITAHCKSSFQNISDLRFGGGEAARHRGFCRAAGRTARV